jgi:hypothetical protein
LEKQNSSDDYDVMQELKLGRLANALFNKILDFERALIRIGVRFPCGGSLFIAARKI